MSISGTLYFTGHAPSRMRRQGFVVRFAVPPAVGDRLEIDQYSVRQLGDERLHVTDWEVVEVAHSISFAESAQSGDPALPETELNVTVRPAAARTQRARSGARSRRG